ncbi:MAG: hypothetical protein ACREOH_17915, partial [Candidatus Entotheonellia bacterium]
MRRRYHDHVSATVRRILLTLSILLLSTCATASAAVNPFLPPSNVVAEVSPELHKYDVHRIAIISFVNQSATPDAGVRIANFFFDELETYQRYEIASPLQLDEEMELEFTRTAQGAPEEDRPGRLRQFVRQWVGRLWPSTTPQPAGRTPQTPAPAGSAGQSVPPLDAVLTGVITRYDDRNGSAFAVDQPASVAYEVYL